MVCEEKKIIEMVSNFKNKISTGLRYSSISDSDAISNCTFHISQTAHGLGVTRAAMLAVTQNTYKTPFIHFMLYRSRRWCARLSNITMPSDADGDIGDLELDHYDGTVGGEVDRLIDAHGETSGNICKSSH